MVIILTGASHTGKTFLAQKLLEKYKYPYLSLDHLKMGLIRSKQTELTVYDDEELTNYLWPITKEIIKTALENNQNLIIEGSYIPFDWQKDFDKIYLKNIKFLCLTMSKNYIHNNFDKIIENQSIIEQRLYNDFEIEEAINQNDYYYNLCKQHNQNCYLIDEKYDIEKILKRLENIIKG